MSACWASIFRPGWRLRSRKLLSRADSGPALAAAPMDAATALQCGVQLRRNLSPSAHGLVCRGIQIPDRKVRPFDATRLHRLAELGHAQHLELVVFDQAQDGVGTPSLDRVQVEIKVSIPCGAKDTLAFLAGTKRDAQSPVSEGHVINAQGVCDARSNQSRLLLVSIRFDTRLGVRQFRTYEPSGWVVTWCYSIKITFEQGLRDHVSFRFAEQSEALAACAALTGGETKRM